MNAISMSCNSHCAEPLALYYRYYCTVGHAIVNHLFTEAIITNNYSSSLSIIFYYELQRLPYNKK